MLLEGRWFKPGMRELVAGKALAKRYPQARPGGKLKFGKGYWDVVGVLDGGDSAINSEIFGGREPSCRGFESTKRLQLSTGAGD